MPSSNFVRCKNCNAHLGKQNTSGFCRTCAMRDNWRRRHEEDASYMKLLEACRAANPVAVMRFHEWLNDREQSQREQLAIYLGTKFAVRFSKQVSAAEAKRAWRREQNASLLPDLAIVAHEDYFQVVFFNNSGQTFSADIKSRFESAVQRDFPGVTVQWSDLTGGPKPPRREYGWRK